MIEIVLIAVAVLLIFRAPIFVALGAPALLYLSLKGVPTALAPQRMGGTIDESILLAVPMFLLAGRLMNLYGATERIFDFAQAIVGHIRGGLGYVAVIASMIFSAMSGSAAADAVGVGTITVKEMRKRGYDPSFAAAVTLGSATLAPVVPPSIIMIIFGATANVSIGKMFLGGVVPGLLMAAGLMITVGYLSWKRGYPKGDPFSFSRVFKTMWRAALVLGTPVLIIGGIFSGIFTPTEASVIAVVYVILIGLIYGKLEWQGFFRAVVATGTAVGALMVVVSVSGVDAWVIAREQIPTVLAAAMSDAFTSKLVAIVAILLLALLLGFFMDATPIILMVVPVIMPVVQAFNIDPVHLGVLFCIVCVIGLITPPVGVALYGVAMVSKLSIEQVFWAALPFFVLLIVSIIILILIPDFVLFLPNLLITQ